MSELSKLTDREFVEALRTMEPGTPYQDYASEAARRLEAILPHVPPKREPFEFEARLNRMMNCGQAIPMLLIERPAQPGYFPGDTVTVRVTPKEPNV